MKYEKDTTALWTLECTMLAQCDTTGFACLTECLELDRCHTQYSMYYMGEMLFSCNVLSANMKSENKIWVLHDVKICD